MTNEQFKELMQTLSTIDWHIQDVAQAIKDSSAQNHRDMQDLIKELNKK